MASRQQSARILGTLVLFLGVSAPGGAQVVRDGSIGPGTSVQPIGPDYRITEAMGERAGSNLFHSFVDFSLGSTESATFEAGSFIQNIFSRVTGGRPSFIDGRLTSPTNLFFINPYGLLFGPSAMLNVAGSFHASTAHYLDFADNTRFYSSLGPGSVLSLAEPRQFGFLDQNRAPIAVVGRFLSAPALSLVGGDVVIVRGNLSAPGPVVIRGGEVVIDQSSHVSSATNIDIDAKSLALSGGSTLDIINRTGPAGNIHIRATDLVEISGFPTYINTDTATSAPSGHVRIDSGTLRISDRAQITTGTFLGSTGAGGNIDLNATRMIEITGNAAVQSTTFTSSAAGNVTMRAPVITVSDEGRITAGTQSSGNGGEVRVSTGALTVSSFGQIDSTASGIATGRGGSVSIDAATIELTNFGRISTNTAGSGNAGDVTVNAQEIRLSDFGRISSETATTSTGSAGSITVHAEQMYVEGNSFITTQSQQGAGGDLWLDVAHWLEVVSSEISTTVRGGDGGGGNVLITMGSEPDVDVMILQASKLTANAVSGPGGNMRIVTDLFVKSAHGSTIMTANSDIGIDGEIQIDAPDTSVIGTVTTLPAVFLDAAGLIREGCAAQRPQGASTLLLGGRGGLPATPGGLLPADTPPVPAATSAGAPQYAAAVIGTTSHGRAVLLRVTCGSPRKAG